MIAQLQVLKFLYKTYPNDSQHILKTKHNFTTLTIHWFVILLHKFCLPIHILHNNLIHTVSLKTHCNCSTPTASLSHHYSISGSQTRFLNRNY